MASRRKLVLGNWKMNGSRSMIRLLCAGLWEKGGALGPSENGPQVGLFPPFPYLDMVIREVRSCGVGVGAQDLSPSDAGAFTGDVSGAMLADLGCTWVLIGHSERRMMHNETDAQVGAKMAAALKHGLTPVLCVGETLQEREAGITRQVIERQLVAALAENGAEGLGRSVIAYEPVWAIGTGRTATPEQAHQVHAFIRDWVASAAPEFAKVVPIVYGGSVKASNAARIFATPDVDGGLIGGASLDAAEFAAIVRDAA